MGKFISPRRCSRNPTASALVCRVGVMLRSPDERRLKFNISKHSLSPVVFAGSFATPCPCRPCHWCTCCACWGRFTPNVSCPRGPPWHPPQALLISLCLLVPWVYRGGCLFTSVFAARPQQDSKFGASGKGHCSSPDLLASLVQSLAAAKSMNLIPRTCALEPGRLLLSQHCL